MGQGERKPIGTQKNSDLISGQGGGGWAEVGWNYLEGHPVLEQVVQ